MFQINDAIIYGGQGVCIISDIEEKTVKGIKKTYFVLKPVDEKGPTIFAPADNEQILKKMRKLLTKDEIDRLIDAMPEEDMQWVADDNARKEQFKNILAKGDHSELIKMIKVIYAHRQQLEAERKRLHLADDRFFHDAEQALYNEFQYVLQLGSKDDLMAYIFGRIEAANK